MAAAEPADFSRWSIVVAAGIGLIVGNGPMMQFTFGVFLKPIGEDLGLSRGTVSAALSIGLLGTALGAPVAGHAMDRWGARPVILVSVLLFAAMLALQGLLARGIVSLFMLSGLMGIVAAGQSPIGYARIVVTWFEERRGLALGLAMTGVGVGTIAMPVVAARIVAVFGWRVAYGGLATVLLMVAVPAILLGLRERAPAVMTTGNIVREGRVARRRSDFWRLAAAFFLVALAANGTIAHVVPMLTDRGVNPVRSTGALAWIGLALICGRLLAGWLLDRLDPVLVTASFFCAVLAGIVLLAVGAVGTVGVALILIGLGLGAEIDLLAFLIGRMFGKAAFGELYGTVFALFMIGSSLGPMGLGLSFDWLGSYRTGLACLAMLLAVAIGLIVSLRRVGHAA